MIELPIDSYLPQITASLRNHHAVVLVAEPGAGKTTRVPPAILRAGLPASSSTLVMLQPRRVAARASAERIAEENDWTIGNEVGWHVRFDRKIGPHTRLRVVTEGILVRQLIDDPFLEGIGCVVLDEFHERSIYSDLSLAFLNELMRSGRDDLKIVVMSATLDAEPVARFLRDCPIIRVPGRTFPVSVSYAAAPSTAPLEERVRSAVQQSLDTAGDQLVFLPGVREIDAAQRSLGSLSSAAAFDVMPLHGGLPFDQQRAALRPSKNKKVILSTNIAETSLTIDGVTTVIDSCLARVASFDVQRGLDRLDLQRISKASAKQRAGRAGRTGPGHCERLLTEKEFVALADFDEPEIRRIDLAPTVLQLHGWGESDLSKFGWFERPSGEAIARSERLLTMLGALRNSKLTELGRSMLAYPLHPRLARLMIAGLNAGDAESAAALAALISEKDGLEDSAAAKLSAESDVIIRLPAVETLPNLRRSRDQYLRIAERGKSSKLAARVSQTDAALQMILQAYPDRVCRRRANDPTQAVMVGGSGVVIGRETVVQHAEYFVAVDTRQIIRGGKPETLVTVASRIEPQWLDALFPDAVQKRNELTFDLQSQRVIGKSIVSYHDLIMRESRDMQIDPQLAGQVLGDALAATADARLMADPEAAILLARIELLRKAMPEHAWPTVDPAEVVREWSRGKISVEQLARTSAAEVIAAKLVYPLDRLLEQHAPKSIQVPSGSNIRIDYAMNQSPVLAVRLQELFGLTQTPRIAGGRVPVLLHLLGPNYRPVQITEDLASFWKTTYFQVRKDLRVRYPKHSWPEDPLTAPPQAKGRPRGTR